MGTGSKASPTWPLPARFFYGAHAVPDLSRRRRRELDALQKDCRRVSRMRSNCRAASLPLAQAGGLSARPLNRHLNYMSGPARRVAYSAWTSASRAYETCRAEGTKPPRTRAEFPH